MKRLAPFLAFFACVALAVFYASTQGRTEYGDGHPYDGDAYWGQAKYVEAGQPMRGWKPFCYRLGAPYVVGQWYPKFAESLAPSPGPDGVAPPPTFDPQDLLDGFTLLGWICAFLCAGLLFGILRTYGLNAALCWGLVAIYIANPVAPFRFSPFFPAFSDPLAFVFVFGLFLTYRLDATLRPTTLLVLCVLGFIGALIREIVLLVPLTFFGAHLWRSVLGQARAISRLTFLHLLPLASIATGLWLTRMIVVEALGEYTLWSHAREMWRRNGESPEILPLALLIAIGPFVFWLAASLRTSPARQFLMRHKELPIYLVGMLALAVSGGNHTDRFASWMLLAALPWLGFLLQERVAWLKTPSLRVAFFTLLLVGQGLTYRAFAAIPTDDVESLSYPGQAGYQLLAPYGEGVTFGQTISAFMTRENRLPLLLQFGVFGGILLLLAWMDRRKSASTS